MPSTQRAVAALQMNVVLFEDSVDTGHCKFSLALEKHNEKLILMRGQFSLSGNKVMSMPLSTPADLREFIEADPYYERYHAMFERLYAIAAKQWGNRFDNATKDDEVISRALGVVSEKESKTTPWVGLPRITLADGTVEALKWLALLLMTLDHINKHLFDAKLPGVFEAARLCMPLFGFVLAYNLARPGALLRGTHVRAMKRLAFFGTLASPFFMGLGGLIWGWWPLNIMFLLLLATGLIYLIEKGGAAHLIAAGVVFFIGGMFVEFWWIGLAYCLAAWWYCKSPNQAALILWGMAAALLYVINGNYWALLALPLIFAAPYINIKMPRFRYAFYMYYPAHLAVLLLLKIVLF